MSTDLSGFAVLPPADPRAPSSPRDRRAAGHAGYFLIGFFFVVPIVLLPLLATALVSLFAEDGPANYLGIWSVQATTAARNSVLWALFVIVICAAGLGCAVLARRAGRRTRIALLTAFSLPVVTSPLTAGLAFRLLFDPHHGIPGNLLAPDRVWVVLALAFAWQWTGLAFLVFHAGLSRLPTDLLRVVRALGGGRPRVLRHVVVPALTPLAGVAFLIVLIAAVRVFELVLIAAPGSAQSATDVLGLHWWRFRPVLPDGHAAALAMVLFLVVGGVALLVLWRLRLDWPLLPPPEGLPGPGTARTSRTAQATAFVLITAWSLPLLVLILTALRDPDAAATSGWWTGGYAPLANLGAVGGIAEAGLTTAVRGVVVAGLVLVAAAPMAYALGQKRIPRGTAAVLFAAAALLAVVPPQAIAVPLGWALDRMPLAGGPVTLVVIHAGMLAPLGVLLLRNAFTSVSAREISAGLASGTGTFRTVLRARWKSAVTVAVVAVVLVWNDLLVAQLLNWPAGDQLMLLILQQSRQVTTASAPLAAMAVAATLPPALLILVRGRWLIVGLTQGVRR